MAKIILVSILFFPLLNYAEDGNWFEKGNGGFAILCDGQPPQTLDLYEATFQYKLTLDRKYDSDVQKRVKYLISKVKKFNPKRALVYEDWAETFMQESEFIPNLGFGALPDLGNSNFDTTICKPQQVIYQRQPDAFKTSRYTVNATLWNALSPLDQAALIMHELIYREFALPPNSHGTSEYARHFNAWLNSLEFNKANLQAYVITLQQLNVIKAEYKGFPILLNLKNAAENTWARLPLIDVKNDLDWPMPPALLPEEERLELFILDASNGFEVTPNVYLSSRCNSPDKTPQTLGMLHLEKNGRINSITRTSLPLGYETCRGVFSPSHLNPNDLIGDFWYFDKEQNLTEVEIAFDEKVPVSEPFDYSEDGLYLFRAQESAFKTKGSKLPLNINLKLSREGHVVSSAFLGTACRATNSIGFEDIILQHDSPTDPAIKLNFKDPAKGKEQFPKCK